MSKSFSLDSFNKDFDNFLQATPVAVPNNLSNKILSKTKRTLKIENIYAITSLIVLHILTTALVIILCPQFDVRFSFSSNIIVNTFMAVGPSVCTFLCGALVLSSSVLMSFLVLPKTYWRYLFHSRYLTTSAISVLTLLSFHIFRPLPIQMATLLWPLGAFVGGLLAVRVAPLVAFSRK